MGRTSVIVVAHNHRAFLADCVRALERAVGGRPDVRLIFIDNASADGTAALVRSDLLSPDGTKTRGGLPAVFIANADNRGFTGGNNQALQRAQDDGDEFAYLLNPDTEVHAGFLEAAWQAARADTSIALVQSLLLRLPPGDVVNTWGNVNHFLGFGYAAGDGTPLDAPATAAHLRDVHDISHASGAGMLVRLEALRTIGLFNEELFTYCEDLDLSWRARLAGFRVVVAPASRVGHKYEFSRSSAKFYLMERNRFLVLAWCYRLRTLALIAPAMAVMEAGVWMFAWRGGWWRDKARACAYFLRPEVRRGIGETRRRVQALRRIGDREATATFSGDVVFSAVSPWLLTRVANPLFQGYWRLVRRLMFW